MRMGLWRIAAPAVAVCAGMALAGCVDAQAPAPMTEISPATATPQAPAANWHWSDAGPAVYLNAAAVTATGNPTASLSLVCNNATPSIMITWDAPLASAVQAGLTYRFDGQTARDVSASPAGPTMQIVSDPLVVSRFIDEAAYSSQLVVSAGATQATFSTTDATGNLKRFRTACPDGTN